MTVYLWGGDSNRPQNRGFTLIEIMVVMGIIAVIALVGVTVYRNAQNGARDAKIKSDIDSISAAYESTYNSSASIFSSIKSNPTQYFTSGSLPKQPNGSDYAIVDGPDAVPSNIASFKVCATLSDGSAYCKSNLQGQPSSATYTPNGSPAPSPS